MCIRDRYETVITTIEMMNTDEKTFTHESVKKRLLDAELKFKENHEDNIN